MDTTQNGNNLQITAYAADSLYKRHLTRFPSPFAVITVNGEKIGTTSIRESTLHPYWNEAFQARVNKNSVIDIQIFDQKDSKKKNQGILGEVKFLVKDVVDLDGRGYESVTYPLVSTEKLKVSGTLDMKFTTLLGLGNGLTTSARSSADGWSMEAIQGLDTTASNSISTSLSPNEQIPAVSSQTVLPSSATVKYSEDLLPPGWERRYTTEAHLIPGYPYFVDHNTGQTTWIEPRHPQSLDPQNQRVNENDAPSFVEPDEALVSSKAGVQRKNLTGYASVTSVTPSINGPFELPAEHEKQVAPTQAPDVAFNNNYLLGPWKRDLVPELKYITAPINLMSMQSRDTGSSDREILGATDTSTMTGWHGRPTAPKAASPTQLSINDSLSSGIFSKRTLVPPLASTYSPQQVQTSNGAKKQLSSTNPFFHRSSSSVVSTDSSIVQLEDGKALKEAVPQVLQSEGSHSVASPMPSHIQQPVPFQNPFLTRIQSDETPTSSISQSTDSTLLEKVVSPNVLSKGSQSVPSLTQLVKDEPHLPQVRQTSFPAASLPTDNEWTGSNDTTLRASQPSFSSPNDRLSTYFDGRSSYTDSDILTIASLLEIAEAKKSWSKVPRTYVILRTMGRLELLDEVVAKGFSDQWLPATSRNLPPCLRSGLRDEFIIIQNRVLTKSMDLEKGGRGLHQNFAKGEKIPLESKGILGSGAFGQVDQVISLISYKEYARKRIPRRNIFGAQTAAAMKEFADEVAVLKRLKHAHIVKFMGSYTDSRYVAVLMSPIAEMDLARYLQAMPVSKAPELRTFFGCLATALRYLHDNDIRHKDIKPANILIHRGIVLLTDFGLARDSADATGSTTAGAGKYTPRYCAPEVAEWEPRNSSSDIWSLGCVFLEMISILKGLSISDFQAYFRDAKNGNGLPFVRTNREAFQKLLVSFETIGLHSDNSALEWIGKMCVVNRFERVNAVELVEMIVAPDEYGEVNGAFCGLCCFHGEESEVETSEDEFGQSPIYQ